MESPGISCFIRKNTPELRHRLEELGYYAWSVYNNEEVLTATYYNFAQVSESLPPMLEPCYCSVDTRYCGPFADPMQDHIDAGWVDCGTNDELFINLAAYRSDTDKNQWFTDGEQWIGCPAETTELGPVFHKATKEELILHFSEPKS